MNSAIVCSVSAWLLVLVVISSTYVAADKPPKRTKLVPYLITPSMRVGRRSTNTWDTNLDDKQLSDKVIPVIRISRSQSRTWLSDEDSYKNPADLGKRTGSNNGMWFGPRLGRVQKRGTIVDDEYQPWTYIIVNGDRPVSRQVHYTPRLGRESEEVDDGIEGVSTTA